MVLSLKPKQVLSLKRGRWGRDVERLNCMITVVKLTNAVCIKPMLLLPLHLLIYRLLPYHLRSLGSHRQGSKNPYSCACWRMLLRMPLVANKALKGISLQTFNQEVWVSVEKLTFSSRTSGTIKNLRPSLGEWCCWKPGARPRPGSCNSTDLSEVLPLRLPCLSAFSLS